MGGECLCVIAEHKGHIPEKARDFCTKMTTAFFDVAILNSIVQNSIERFVLFCDMVKLQAMLQTSGIGLRFL